MQMGLSDEQRGVATGMAYACVSVVALWVVAWGIPAQDAGVGGRLWILGGALLGPGSALAAGVGFVARHRFLHDTAIDGQNPPDDIRLARAHAYLSNTVEQALLAAMVYPALAFGLSADWIGVLPLFSLAFVVGRIGFAMGIGRPARHRAFGFALTFYPTMSGLFVAIILMLTSFLR